jgi:hypothetical protein
MGPQFFSAYRAFRSAVMSATVDMVDDSEGGGYGVGFCDDSSWSSMRASSPVLDLYLDSAVSFGACLLIKSIKSVSLLINGYKSTRLLLIWLMPKRGESVMMTDGCGWWHCLISFLFISVKIQFQQQQIGFGGGDLELEHAFPWLIAQSCFFWIYLWLVR